MFQLLENNEKLTLLAQVLELTQAMQQKADLELWDEMIELQQQRQPFFDKVFPITESTDIDKLRSTVEEILELNTKLEQQCDKQKQTIQLQLKGMNKNKKAVNAYQST